MTPAEAAVNNVSTSGTTNEGARTYTVSGLGTTPVNSTGFDCAEPVVFVDADNDNQLDVTATGAPEEDFGVGGERLWIPAEAVEGADLTDATVQFVNTADDLFVADGARFNYDAGDVFRYDGDTTDVAGSAAITLAQWETALNIGDVVDLTDYSRSFQNQFGLDDDFPAAPTGVTATAGDFDADPNDTNSDDVRVNWTASTNGLIASYTATLYDDDPNTAGCQTGTQVAQTTGITGTTTDFEELADDTYCVIVVAVSESGNNSPASQPAFVEVDVVPTDASRPTMTDARVITDAGTLGALDAGDIILLTFSEDMNASTIEGRFLATDFDGDQFQISCEGGGNATCTLAPSGANADRILRLVLTGAPADLNAGTGSGAANYPATITATDADVRDEAGNIVDLAASSDVVVDDEGATADPGTATATAQSATHAGWTRLSPCR